MAPFAILHHFDTFRCIFLVLVCTIIAALAFCACKSNSFTHYLHLTQTSGPRPINMLNQYIISNPCKSIFFTLKKAGPSQRNYNIIIRGKMQIPFCNFFIPIPDSSLPLFGRKTERACLLTIRRACFAVFLPAAEVLPVLHFILLYYIYIYIRFCRPLRILRKIYKMPDQNRKNENLFKKTNQEFSRELPMQRSRFVKRNFPGNRKADRSAVRRTGIRSYKKSLP